MTTTTTAAPEYLTPEDLVARYRDTISAKTLANWRSAGTGPAFTKLGGKVLYAITDVLTWEANSRRQPKPANPPPPTPATPPSEQ
jgi:hypothetical protein